MAIFENVCYASIRYIGFINNKSYAKDLADTIKNEAYFEECFEAGKGSKHQFIIMLKFDKRHNPKKYDLEQSVKINKINAQKALKVFKQAIINSSYFPAGATLKLDEDKLILSIINNKKW